MNQSIEQRNGWRLGDAARLPCCETVYQVAGLDDPSLVTLKAPDGRLVKAGYRVLVRVKAVHDEQP